MQQEPINAQIARELLAQGHDPAAIAAQLARMDLSPQSGGKTVIAIRGDGSIQKLYRPKLATIKPRIGREWDAMDTKPRVDAPRLSKPKKRPAPPHINHAARYRKLKKAGK